MEKTIKNLVKGKKKVYVYLKDKETGVRFIRQAEHERFTFCDGELPTKRNFEEYMAVNPDFTLNYIGTNGRIAVQTKKNANKSDIEVIDYSEYI